MVTFRDNKKVITIHRPDFARVAPEIVMIAAQKGLVSMEEEFVSIGKWDVTLVIKPLTKNRFS